MGDQGVNTAVLYEVVERHIALVTLNRPDKRNAVNGDVARGLEAAVKAVEADDDIRVAVLTSNPVIGGKNSSERNGRPWANSSEMGRSGVISNQRIRKR